MSETNDCLIRLVPFAIWSSQLELDDLSAALRLVCGFTHTNELIIECCYLYCYTIKQLIVHNLSNKEAY